MKKYRVGNVFVEYPDYHSNEKMKALGNSLGGFEQTRLNEMANAPIELGVLGQKKIGEPKDIFGNELFTHNMSIQETVELIARLQQAVNEYTDRIVYTSIEIKTIY